MKQFQNNKFQSGENSSWKFMKLKFLLENSNKNKSILFDNPVMSLKESSQQNIHFNLSKDLPLYFSFSEKPLNLLFSMDQFLFEFSKKTYQQKKRGEFFQQLKERKKLSLFYGHLTRKQIVNIFNQVKQKKGSFAKNLFCLLEKRLDVVLYRSGLTKTIAQARQLIKHNKILVNQKILNVPSYLLNPGDVISLTPKASSSINYLLDSRFPIIDKKKWNNVSPNLANFYSKISSCLDFSNPKPSHSLSSLDKQEIKHFWKKNPGFQEKKRKMLKLEKSSLENFPSKKLCRLYIQLLCIRLKNRCYWIFYTNQFFSTQVFKNHDFFLLSVCPLKKSLETICCQKSPHSLPKKSPEWGLFWHGDFFGIKRFLETKFDTNFGTKEFLNSDNKNFPYSQKFMLTAFKKKSFSQKKRIFFPKSTLKRSFKQQNNQQEIVSSNQGGLQKKPLFWAREILLFPQNNKRILFKKGHKKSQNQPANQRNSLKRQKLAIYRKSFLMFLNYLENSKKFKGLVHLSIKKYLFKQLAKRRRFTRILNFRLIRPCHVEISYNLLKIVYLFSPQRVNFPFPLDLELVKRSLR